MTDIHSHLLYDVDDGPKTIEESIEVLKELKNVGFDNVILTPHYIKGSSYNSSKRNNVSKLNVLKNALKDNNIDINLYLGNEIYIDDEIYELFKKNEISTLNNTNYALIELPMSGKYDEYKEILIDLLNKGCKVILAHPERYISFQQDFNKIYELEKIGVYFQCNFDSIIGKYGEEAEKMVRRMFIEKKVAFLATDIHHKAHDYNKYKLIREEVLKYLTEEEYDIITTLNPNQLLG